MTIPHSLLDYSPASGLFLHASAVAVDGGAVLFLGHSTAGKSTIARLTGTAHPVLADDSVFVSRGADGAWRVVDGSFRFERDDLANFQERIYQRSEGKAAVPLRGCFRIHKAAATRIELLAPVDLARYLMDAVMEVDLQRKVSRVWDSTQSLRELHYSILEARKSWFRQVALIARHVQGWHLWFPLDLDIQEWNRMLVETLS